MLFLLAAGFTLIFGLTRIANLAHGGLFMLGAYIGVTVLRAVPNLWIAALAAGAAVAAFGGLLERLVLRKLGGDVLSQALATLGVSFIIADACLLVWGGEAIPLPAPASLQMPVRMAGFVFPAYRLAVVAIAVMAALALFLLMERTRLGAAIRAAANDADTARAAGIPVSRLFTLVFCLGAALAGAGGVIGGPLLSAYPGLDADMLPLALIVVVLGGAGSLLGAFAGAFVTGFVYTFGAALLPDLAYLILFLPMVLVIVLRPRGLLGRFAL